MQPRIVRQAAARDRATEKAVRLQAIEPRRRYQTMSQSQDDTVYTLTVQGREIACDCPGYAFTASCKHVGALQLRAEREGWGPSQSTIEARILAVELMRGRR